MKLSLKTSSLFVAMAMTIWCLFIIFAQTEFYSSFVHTYDNNFVLSYACSALLLFGMALFGISLYINRNQVPVLSKPLLWQARVITAVLCFMLFCNIFSIASVYINGMLYFWWHGFEWLRYVMLFLITAWLWQFAYIKPKDYLPSKPLGNCGLAVSIGVGVVLLLMFISLVHVLFTGHVAGFRTNVLISWLKPISALVLMGMYLLVHRLSLSITPESHSGK